MVENHLFRKYHCISTLRLLKLTHQRDFSTKIWTNMDKSRLKARGYPYSCFQKITFEIKFNDRKPSLQQRRRICKKILPFTTTYPLSLSNLKKILMSKWHLIQNQPLLREIYKDPPPISYKRGRSLKDMLIRKCFSQMGYFLTVSRKTRHFLPS